MTGNDEPGVANLSNVSPSRMEEPMTKETEQTPVIGDPRPSGEEGPAGDQRAAGEEGIAGDPRPGGSETLEAPTEPRPDSFEQVAARRAAGDLGTDLAPNEPVEGAPVAARKIAAKRTPASKVAKTVRGGKSSTTRRRT